MSVEPPPAAIATAAVGGITNLTNSDQNGGGGSVSSSSKATAANEPARLSTTPAIASTATIGNVDPDDSVRQYEDGSSHALTATFYASALIVTAPADSTAIICICGSDIDDNGTIQCDKCGRWQHMRCVGIDPRDADLIEDLVYYCDVCQPRSLDVQAAKDYIEQYKRDDALREATKPKRRSKSSSKRNKDNAAAAVIASTSAVVESGVVSDERKQVSLSEVKKPTKIKTRDSSPQASATAREYTPTDKYIVPADIAEIVATRLKDIAVWPADAIPGAIASSVRPLLIDRNRFGLFADRHAPPTSFIGTFLGVVGRREAYEADERNNFPTLRSPLPQVILVDGTQLIIDARVSGNDLRFMRKSCSPTCSIVPIAVSHQSSRGVPDVPTWQISIILTQQIKPGSELTIPYQWPADRLELIPGLESEEARREYAINLVRVHGDCPCGKAAEACEIRRYLPMPQPLVVTAKMESPPPSPARQPRKRSLSIESRQVGAVDNDQSSAQVSDPSLTPNAVQAPPRSRASAEPKDTSSNVPDAPLSREERKIQMAIARMESSEQSGTDKAKVKRRRRNTGDDLTRPTSSQRRSSNKPLEAEAMPDSDSAAPKASSPSSARRPARVARQTAVKRGSSIIPSLQPQLAPREYVPLKRAWIDSYLAEQKRAADAAAEEAKIAAAAAAKARKEAAEKEAARQEAARREEEQRQQELEKRLKQEAQRALDAAARAREREIWGDRGTGNDLSEPKHYNQQQQHQQQHHQPRPAEALPLRQSNSLPHQNGPVAASVATPSVMGPPASLPEKTRSPTPHEGSPGNEAKHREPQRQSAPPSQQQSPHSPATLPTVPKVVRKLSISEYLRQKKEQAAQTPGSTSGATGQVTPAAETTDGVRGTPEIAPSSAGMLTTNTVNRPSEQHNSYFAGASTPVKSEPPAEPAHTRISGPQPQQQHQQIPAGPRASGNTSASHGHHSGDPRDFAPRYPATSAYAAVHGHTTGSSSDRSTNGWRSAENASQPHHHDSQFTQNSSSALQQGKFSQAMAHTRGPLPNTNGSAPHTPTGSHNYPSQQQQQGYGDANTGNQGRRPS
ncbi:SET domain-containing protein 3 [Savitreella phatthalungensis]